VRGGHGIHLGIRCVTEEELGSDSGRLGLERIGSQDHGPQHSRAECQPADLSPAIHPARHSPKVRLSAGGANLEIAADDENPMPAVFGEGALNFPAAAR